MHCNSLQRTATHCNTLQHPATPCNTLQHPATPCNTALLLAAEHATAKHIATLCNTMQHSATFCNILQYSQHSATHCNTLRPVQRQNRPIFTHKRSMHRQSTPVRRPKDLYLDKRDQEQHKSDLYIHKRDLCIPNDVIGYAQSQVSLNGTRPHPPISPRTFFWVSTPAPHLSMWLGMHNHRFNQFASITRKRPIHGQKRPVYTQKRPMHTQKRPVYTQKRPMHTQGCAGSIGIASIIQKRPRYRPKRPIYIQKKPMHAQRCAGSIGIASTRSSQDLYIDKWNIHTDRRDLDIYKRDLYIHKGDLCMHTQWCAGSICTASIRARSSQSAAGTRTHSSGLYWCVSARYFAHFNGLFYVSIRLCCICIRLFWCVCALAVGYIDVCLRADLHTLLVSFMCQYISFVYLYVSLGCVCGLSCTG